MENNKRTMTPKDKAIELVNKYLELGKDFTRGVSMQEFSKECALIAVNETIEAMEFNSWQNWNEIEYYQEVKQEIENI